MMNKIIITGGYGFIGSHFVEWIYNNTNAKILVIDKMTYAAEYENIPLSIREDRVRFRFNPDDICNVTTESLHNFADAEYIVNFAAESHVDNSISNSAPFIKSNIEGVYNLLEVAKEMPNLKKFVQISTDEVYGDMEDVRHVNGATESFALRPSSAYSASKASADLAIIAAARTFNIPYLITRSCNNFGPRQHSEKFLPTLFKCVEEGTNIPVYGDGLQKREWIHVSDNVAIIAELMLSTSLMNEVFNISSSYHHTNMDIIKKVKGFAKEVVRFDHVEDRKGHDREYRINCSKLMEYLEDFVFLSLEGYLRDVAREKSLINGG